MSIKNVLRFVKSVRDSFDGAVIVYTHGSCYQFHLILKEVFPSAKPYSNHNHVISKIGRKYYDITGLVDPKGYIFIGDDKTWIKRVQKLKWRFRW